MTTDDKIRDEKLQLKEKQQKYQLYPQVKLIKMFSVKAYFSVNNVAGKRYYVLIREE